MPTIEQSFRKKRVNLKLRYKISLEDYENMYHTQEGCCAICGKHNKDNFIGKRQVSLAVDHCHNSNRIRELLCSNCNLVIGNAKESIEVLEKAIEYLKKHQIALGSKL